MPSPRLRPLVSTAWNAGLGLLYPERCVACGAFGDALCGACEAAFVPIAKDGACPKCAANWPGPLNCPRCMQLDAIESVHAAVDMTGAARRVVHGLKYRGIRSLAPRMASHMSPLAHALQIDAALAVPLHRSRMRRRGFNQSELLLTELGWHAGAGALIRRRKTRTQVGRHLAERRGNVAGAFAYAGPPLAGLALAIIDDVVTTGATANECARVLRDHGARTVYVIAFARASYDPNRANPAMPD
ncbi:MAG: ComF family protein [Chloroflexi bacterium]|nr:ComF family protein [Chloroflexota bacterium]